MCKEINCPECGSNNLYTFEHFAYIKYECDDCGYEWSINNDEPVEPHTLPLKGKDKE